MVMAITIKQKKLYSKAGNYLKTLSCPKRVKQSELEISDSENQIYHCANCDKDIINTDMLNEQEIENVLTAAPETCVYINPVNPVFNIVLSDESDDFSQLGIAPL